ncbi:hypothetical protein [Amphibacillus sediminis]|uniref:hypothetical protein n=1 Tax=Amphibacillus sediminis TaxID=360185 RepID=UPI000829D65D|nr:hypothetical protein [Amphibacillus sediminis]
MKNIENLLKVGLYLQLLWYVLFFTNLLGVIGSRSELLQDIVWLGIPSYGLIVAIVYILKRKLKSFVLLEMLLSLSIIFLWIIISGISQM